MVVSKVRKEEAELRQIAKQSRLARKEAHARERKQKQREMRAKAKAEAAGEPAPEAKSTTTAAKSSSRKRQGAVILPEEVQEMKQRLLMDTAGATTTAVAQPLGKGKRAKKAAKQPDAKSTSVSSAGAGEGTSSSPSSSSSSPHPSPNYHLEIHYKKKQVLVDVVLHRIPHQKIDVSETTATQLVVDTTKHTKKYRLVLPMPGGIRVVPSEAEYEADSGVLHCVLPIEGGEVPEELQKEWDGMIEKVRAQKALRFRVSKDGELTVRSRQALLAKDTAAQAALQEKLRKEKKRGRSAGSGDDDDENENGKALEVTDGQAVAKKRKADKKPPKAEKTGERNVNSDSAAVPAAAAAAPPAKSAGKQADVFAADHAKSMEAARAAAAQAHQSIRERVKLAKQVQAQRQARSSTRTERRERKQERKEASFLRVLEEQKQQLAAKAQLAAAVEEAEKKLADAKKNGPPGKSVSFA